LVLISRSDLHGLRSQKSNLVPRSWNVDVLAILFHSQQFGAERRLPPSRQLLLQAPLPSSLDACCRAQRIPRIKRRRSSPMLDSIPSISWAYKVTCARRRPCSNLMFRQPLGERKLAYPRDAILEAIFKAAISAPFPHHRPPLVGGLQKVRHLFQKRFVSVLVFWCLTRHKALKLHHGAIPAGIAIAFFSD
jgi:hypothetical protein